MGEQGAALVLEPVPADELGRGSGVPPARFGRPFWRLVVPWHVLKFVAGRPNPPVNDTSKSIFLRVFVQIGSLGWEELIHRESQRNRQVI